MVEERDRRLLHRLPFFPFPLELDPFASLLNAAPAAPLVAPLTAFRTFKISEPDGAGSEDLFVFLL